jgi:hypothetical protein
MFAMSMSIGPVNVQIDTDERLSFDAIDSILNRGAATTLTLFDEHLGSMIKYENYDNDNDTDVDCDECAAINEELD